MIKILLFDLDGTLVDTENDIADALNYSLKYCGLPTLTQSQINAAIGNGFEKLIERCLPSDKKNFQAQVSQVFKAYYLDHCVIKSKPYSGVLPLLKKLQPLKLAILSNKAEKYCRVILEELNLTNFFLEVIGGDTFPTKKPDPMGLNFLLNQFKLQPHEAIMIGDSVPDIAVGHALGVDTIGITAGIGNTEQLTQSKPTHLISSFSELEGLLKQEYAFSF